MTGRPHGWQERHEERPDESLPSTSDRVGVVPRISDQVCAQSIESRISVGRVEVGLDLQEPARTGHVKTRP